MNDFVAAWSKVMNLDRFDLGRSQKKTPAKQNGARLAKAPKTPKKQSSRR